MRGWTRVERRWRDALLAAIIPGQTDAHLPGLGELDLSPFWDVLEREAPTLLRLGFRISVWVLTMTPLLLIGVPRLFTGLDPVKQGDLLQRAAMSRSYLLAQLVTTLKALACLAYFRDPTVRHLVTSRSEVQ